jgi:predicted ATPase/class 3 adenylate cyclase/DNA-binding CsgD family transcriptional regulator
MSSWVEQAQEPGAGAAGLPSGTVTFVLGDIAGSTRLWEERAETMPAVLAALDGLVARLVEAHAGARPAEQGEGDNFVAAFPKAADAMAFAAALQASLGDETWSAGLDVRLRMAVHTGDARRRDEGRYMGETLNRCARLRALAHPGQVLVSATTAGLVADRLSGGWFLRDLGLHRLRDLSRPERIAQLCGPDVPFDFPPLASLDRMPNNLPVQLTTFIGRIGELTEASLLLTDRRLLTLTGAGGSGKTRLAVQLAGELVDEFSDGIWFADLAPVIDADLVPAGVARAAGISEIPGQPLIESLTGHLAGHTALLILDNCEHLLDACAALTEQLLRACPTLRVLATSREPLGAEGETVYRVPPLGVPADERDHDCESVRLFTDRASLARPTLRIGPGEAAAITAICARLEGIPLAIELAAARCGALTPAQIAERLEVHFRLLTGGRRHGAPRQRALEASLDWSYELLSEEERLLFRTLAVFAGGFTLDAVETIGAAGPLSGWTIVDRLSALVDKCLVVEASADGDGRYRLLEPVREYAQRKLIDAGEAEPARRRHAEFYEQLVEHVGNAMFGEEMLASRRCLETELDNIRVACDWANSQGETDMSLGLVAPLSLFWPAHHLSEGYRRVEEALALPGGSLPQRAMVLRAATECACHANDFEGFVKYTAEAVDLVGDADPGLRGEALAVDAWVKFFSGDPDGRAVGDEAVGLLRQSPLGRHRYALVDVLWGLGCDGIARGDGTTARRYFDEALRAARELGNPMAVGRSRMFVAYLEALEGNLAQAAPLLRTAQSLLAESLDDTGLFVDAVLGWVAALGGDLDGGFAAVRTAVEEACRRQQFVVLAFGALLFQAMLEARAEPGSIPESIEQTEQVMGECGFPWGVVWCGALRAEALARGGDIDAARRAVDGALRLADSAPHAARGRGAAELARARVERAGGQPAVAEDAAYRALASHTSAGMKLGTIDTLEVIATLAADQGSVAEAARLFAATDRARRDLGYSHTPAEAARLAEDLNVVRSALGDDIFDATWAAGAAMALEQAQTYATRGRGARRRPVSGWSSLTPTELEVVGLVVEGLRNADIASRLFVSPETVKTHISNILAKLGVANRTELAALASRRT